MRARQGPALWLALLAATASALWPLAAYARPGVLELPLELCTTRAAAPQDGATGVPLPGAPAEHASHLPHCAFCSVGGANLPALHDAADRIVYLPATGDVASIPRDVPRTQDSPFLPARPRGPPDSRYS